VTAPKLSRTERIARLIALPSVSSAAPGWDQSNASVIHELATWLEDLGFAIELMPINDQPKKLNLIATLGRGEGGLIFAGHTDTVPYDAERWTSDPFKLREADGKLFGLGTCDMKGFLALAIEAAEGLRADALQQPLIFLATADEESSMDGARALVTADRRLGRNAVIGEPTNLAPIRAHKGILFERITIEGKSGHSSDPRLGNNAIDGMARVLTALIRYREELGKKFRNPTFSVPEATMNLGRLHGGDSANRIAAHCELDLDVRVLPGMDLELLRAEIKARAEEAIAGSGLILTQQGLFSGMPHELSEHAALVKACEQLTGVPASTVGFGTEAPYFAQLGVDTIVLGPGGVTEAHKPDEFVNIANLDPTVKILRSLIDRFCIAH
jgi:acetylornithine deacetylase